MNNAAVVLSNLCGVVSHSAIWVGCCLCLPESQFNSDSSGRRSSMGKFILNLVVISLLASCGAGSGKGLNSQGLPITSSSASNSSVATTVSLAQLQQNIFGAICIRCHIGSTAPHGLRFDSEDNSYAFLVNHPSEEIPTLMRVNPGHPDDSYIVQKLEGSPTIVGSQMPLDGPPYLSEEQINRVRDWIANGAPRAGTGSGNTKITRVTAEKSGDEFNASIHFSRAIQFETLTDNSVNIQYNTVNSKTTDSKPISVAATDFSLNDQTLSIKLRDITAEVQKISIDINPLGSQAVLDNEGREIDGDNNDVEGGGYHYEYKN